MPTFLLSPRSRSTAVAAAALSAGLGLGLGLTGPATGATSPSVGTVVSAAAPTSKDADALLTIAKGGISEAVSLPVSSWAWGANRRDGGSSVSELQLTAASTPDTISLIDWLRFQKSDIPEVVLETADGRFTLRGAYVTSVSESHSSTTRQSGASLNVSFTFATLERTIGDRSTVIRGPLS